jgi:hypothetical protein
MAFGVVHDGPPGSLGLARGRGRRLRVQHRLFVRACVVLSDTGNWCAASTITRPLWRCVPVGETR